MVIEQVDVFVFKADYHYQIGGHKETPNRLPATDYYLEPQWPHAYSRRAECCIVKLTTDSGLVGWGEASAPVVPETPCSIIANLVGPALLGQNPLSNEVIYDRLFRLMDVRGHTSGFMIDAIAAVDIAVWDLRGKHLQAPVCSLLGGPFRTELPAYVSGLRQPTLEEKCRVAKERVSEGFPGVKVFSGESVKAVTEEFLAVRESVGADAFLAVDVLCKYRLADAQRLGHVLDEHHASWFEAPMNPDDVHGHQQLAQALKTPIAIGEHLRSVPQFMTWMEQDGLDIAQPDVPRTGITAAKKIADLAAAHHRQVALHVGIFTGIGMAATWQVAAALPNFLIQEHQYDLFGAANKVLKTPLAMERGRLKVPLGPGLGVDVNEGAVLRDTVEQWRITPAGKTRVK